jgi:hypothetical protein
MADRYWVGGSGTWSASATTNWSATSGGPSGASVPTLADSVFFDQAGAYTVTCIGGQNCLNFTISAGTVTITGSFPTLSVYGSFSIVAGTVWSTTSTITFRATTTGNTVTTNGVVPASNFTFNGAGGAWTLGSALNIPGYQVTVTQGTFNSGNYNITSSSISSSGGFTRQINLGSSTITLNGINALDFLSPTGLTFNAGTSEINLSGGTATIRAQFPVGTGFTFYNVNFTSTSVSTRNIQGRHTFNNLSVTGPNTQAGFATILFEDSATINGVLSTNGTAANRRVRFITSPSTVTHSLIINSTPNLTDANFDSFYVSGTAAPISGTRLAVISNCKGITPSTPKTVYWNLAGTQFWWSNGWSNSPTGTPSEIYYPLPQDTAVFTDAGSAESITLSGVIGSVDMSARTSAMTITISSAVLIYGNWKNGPGTTISTTAAVNLQFIGDNDQTITSAGKFFSCGITVDKPTSGTVQLGDALVLSDAARPLTITSGSFSTNGYALTISHQLTASFNRFNKAINLGSSTVTLGGTTGISLLGADNLVFNAGTSQINLTQATSPSTGIGLTFYNVSFLSTANPSIPLNTTTFNNLTVSASTTGNATILLNDPVTINGTLTCIGASGRRRINIYGNSQGTQRTLNVNSISSNHTNWRDINLTGAASSTTLTGANNIGNNTGIIFAAPKTVYWNLAGTQAWDSDGWALTSGGIPNSNNYPLLQDTAIIDNNSAGISINLDGADVGTLDTSARSTTFGLIWSTNAFFYGNVSLSNSITLTGIGALAFAGSSNSTFASNGLTINKTVGVYKTRPTTTGVYATLTLQSALTTETTIGVELRTGKFNSNGYSVTTATFKNFASAASNTLILGASTWTIASTSSALTSTVWDCATLPTIIAGTSNIVINTGFWSQISFSGGGGNYNKVTLSTPAFNNIINFIGSNFFSEIVSTKTTAYSLFFTYSTTNTIEKWSVSGTAGNIVTLNSTIGGINHTLVINGPAVETNYLAIGNTTISDSSYGEFYAGPNSTGSSGAGNVNVIFTAKPAPRTLYWHGGTGAWSETSHWGTESASLSNQIGYAIPRSIDTVVFDSASSAAAYTVTISGVTTARCAGINMAGPATGNITFAGSIPLVLHGNTSFASTGITYSLISTILCGSNSSYTLTTNGLALRNILQNGSQATWVLGSALATPGWTFTQKAGTLTTAGYALTASDYVFNNTLARRVLNFDSSTISATAISTFTPGVPISADNLTLNPGTSTISTIKIDAAGLSLYNLSILDGGSVPANIINVLSVNNLIFQANTVNPGVSSEINFSTNLTVSGTLIFNAGTNSGYRRILKSSVLGTERTLTCNAVSAITDYDFRDIRISGNAVSGGNITGTRLGDGKGNSNITFTAPKTVYFASTISTSWAYSEWSATSGGAVNSTLWPLPQDTAIIPATLPPSGSTITLGQDINIGSIDFSQRTLSNPITLDWFDRGNMYIHGNFTYGTGVTTSTTPFTGSQLFVGRNTQNIISNGKAFRYININSPGGTVVLQDAFIFTEGPGFLLTAGTFNANNYNVTSTVIAPFSTILSLNSTNTRTLAMGSGTWTFASYGTNLWLTGSILGLTVSSDATINFTSTSGTSTFHGSDLDWGNLTLNLGSTSGGSTQNISITGNNKFKTITNTHGAFGPSTVSIGSTNNQTLKEFNSSGTANRRLTITGQTSTQQGYIVFASTNSTNKSDYVIFSNIFAIYPSTGRFNFGKNSTVTNSFRVENTNIIFNPVGDFFTFFS